MNKGQSTLEIIMWAVPITTGFIIGVYLLLSSQITTVANEVQAHEKSTAANDAAVPGMQITQSRLEHKVDAIMYKIGLDPMKYAQ